MELNIVYFAAEVYLVPLYSHAASLGLLSVKACLNMRAARFHECADVLQVSKYFGPDGTCSIYAHVQVERKNSTRKRRQVMVLG